MGNIKKKITGIVKSNDLFYRCYFFIGSLFVNILKLFVKTQDNLILFVSYGGKEYSDSPRVIYEIMCKDKRFEKYELVWAFQEPEVHSVPGKAKVVKIDTLKYFLISLKSRVWVTNVVVERALNFRGKNTFYFGTWHGTPIKKIGGDVNNNTFNTYARYQYDAMCAQSEFEASIWERVFDIKKDKIMPFGLPRNDVLATVNTNDQFKMKEKLGISVDKKVILYTPTYRDGQGYVMDIPVNFKHWRDVLGEDYVIFFRAHSAVIQVMNIDTNNDYVYDMSNYPDLTELMIASDMLVSDYSSIYFDYSILEKPMFCFAYDYEEYSTIRGLYFDIRKELLGGYINEDELIELIKSTPFEKAKERTIQFKEKYVEYYGDAGIKSVDLIFNNIQ